MNKHFWEKCEITGKSFNSFRGFLNNLRKFNMTSKEYYDKYVKEIDEGFCIICKNTTKYKSGKYNNYCSYLCASRCQIKLHNVINRYSGDDREEKLISFRIKRIGVNTNNAKRQETIEKKCIDLGITKFEYHSQITKKSSDLIAPEKRLSMTLKAVETRSKSSVKDGNVKSNYKDYMLYGNKIIIQGYEWIVLDYLQEKYENDFFIADGKKIGFIRYNTKSLYFPDIRILSKNIIIEIKSEYTYKLNRKNVFEKMDACIEQGYNTILIIFKRSEERNLKLDGYKKLLDLAISSQSPNATFYCYGAGSTTILNGVDGSPSKCQETIDSWFMI